VRDGVGYYYIIVTDSPQAGPRRKSVDFVAEGCPSNHHRDLDPVPRVHRCGPPTLDRTPSSFQLFRIAELFAPRGAGAQGRSCGCAREWELPVAFLPAAGGAFAAPRGNSSFGCTPFLSRRGRDAGARSWTFLKVASYELLWTELLRRCARDRQAGRARHRGWARRARRGELRRRRTLKRGGLAAILTLLHCVSGYPAPVARVQSRRDPDDRRRRRPGRNRLGRITASARR